MALSMTSRRSSSRLSAESARSNVATASRPAPRAAVLRPACCRYIAAFSNSSPLTA